MVKKNNWAASGFSSNVSPDVVTEEFFDVEVVILLQGSNLFGDAIYSYLKIVGRNLKEMFAKMQKGENFTPSDYGTVIQAGRGEPSQQVKDEMKLEYNMMDIAVPQVQKPVFVQPKFFGED